MLRSFAQVLSVILPAFVILTTVNAASAVSLYPSTILSDNPVAYFPLDESNGSATVTDVIGARTGTVFAGATLGVAPGPLTFGNSTAASFNGSTGKIDVAFDPTLNTSVFTIEAWARVAGGAGSYRSPITSRTSAGGAKGYLFYADPSNKWNYWTGTGGWATVIDGDYVPGEWTHLVGTSDGATMRFFVNGVPVGSTAAAVIPNATYPFRIGAGDTDSAGAFFFNGDVAEVAYYNTVLSDARILAHYDAAFLQVVPAPEPTTATLLGLGILGIARVRRRRMLTAPKDRELDVI